MIYQRKKQTTIHISPMSIRKDIDDLFKEYRQRNVALTQVISNKPWGLREFGVRTPEGHRIDVRGGDRLIYLITSVQVRSGPTALHRT